MMLGAIKVLRNAMGSRGVSFSGKKVLQGCKVQRYSLYEGVGGVKFPGKKALPGTNRLGIIAG